MSASHIRFGAAAIKFPSSRFGATGYASLHREPVRLFEMTVLQALIVVALPLLNILKDRKSARKVSYNEPLAVPKGHDISLDRQETPSRCVVAPVTAAFQAITSQAEGTAMGARGAPLARRRCRACDYRLAHCRTPRPIESPQCRRGTPETYR
jgi:hypothetical protein